MRRVLYNRLPNDHTRLPSVNFQIMFSRSHIRWLICIFALIPLAIYLTPEKSLLSKDPPLRRLKTISPFGGFDNKSPPSQWYDDNGTPLFYEAWRVKPGTQDSEPTKRSSLVQYGSRVACWPSTGGVWIKHSLRPELDYLGLPHDKDVQRVWPNMGTQEDDFCYKMRLIGADFYTLPPKLNTVACETLEMCVKPDYGAGELSFVWNFDGALAIVNLTRLREEQGIGLAGWNTVIDMEERSRIANIRVVGRTNLEVEDGIRYDGEDIWCHSNPERCQRLWCEAYPKHCHEAKCLPLYPRPESKCPHHRSKF